MKKVKVKMLDSVAGLADPRSTEELDRKYKAKIAQMNQGREKPFSETFTRNFIDEMKRRDRYGEKPLGFPRDWAFKAGDEPYIDAALAENWEAAGMCVVIRDEKKAA